MEQENHLMQPENFSIWSSFDIDLTPEDMVLAMEERKLHYCELSDEHGAMLLERPGTPAETGKAFGEFARQHGVFFPQGHLWLKVQLCHDPDAVEILKKWLELFAAAGVKNAVLHCDGRFPAEMPRDAIIEENAKRLRPLAAYAQTLGIRICLENLGSICRDAEEILKIIQASGDSDALGICLDTGHLNLAKPGTQAEFIRTAGSRLHALHIADNEGQRDQHMMPFGAGNIDFSDVMKALKEIGYRDLFNYEIPGERRLPLSLRLAKTEYLRSVTQYLMSLE